MLKDENHYFFQVSLMHMYSTVATKHFYLEADFFSGENLTCHLTLSSGLQ